MWLLTEELGEKVEVQQSPEPSAEKQPLSRKRGWSSLDHCLVKARTRCVNDMPLEGRWWVDTHSTKKKHINTCTYIWIHKQRKAGSHKMERFTKDGERLTCGEGTHREIYKFTHVMHQLLFYAVIKY